MMKLIIKLENNQPVNHPILFDNFLMFQPDADYDNLPEGYAKFVRTSKPSISIFEYMDEMPTYELVDGVYTDVWHIRNLTTEEIQEKINQLENQKPYPSWIVDTNTLSIEPPVPYPDDGKTYDWNEEQQSWQEISQ